MPVHTVVLLIPEDQACDYGQEVYHWVGLARNSGDAVERAQMDFARAGPSGEEAGQPDRLHVLLAGKGELQNVIWGEANNLLFQ